MNEMMILIGTLVGLLLGFVVAYFITNRAYSSKIREAEEKAKNILKEAEKEANNLKKEKLLEVKEEWHRRKQEFENEYQQRKTKIQASEKLLKTREEALESKLDLLTKKERQIELAENELRQKEANISKKLEEIEKLRAEQIKKLEEISGLSKEDAKKILIDNFINEAKAEAAQYIKQIRDEAKLNVQKEARNIILEAIQRTASDHSIESTVSVVTLESDEMKGRIIGREGRNIRSFESATGVDLIIDDTPEAVVISGFDPFRREVAKIALERLMQDGRIHPARIEEVVEKVRAELEEEIYKVGEQTTLELGIHNLHPDLIRLVGKMKYRSSYGQNLLNHSIEVAYLCGIMASELGLDPQIAKRAGLLHDIGKCVDQNTEGPHALIGYELAKKYKEHPAVANAIGAHHEDIDMETPYAVLVQAADSISGARPGARRESLENYIKRLEKLETLAQSFDGVQKTFAIQAGREVRVIVEPDKIDDLTADQLAHDIAKKIEQEMEYPGQIKVTVIREKRSFAFAK
ncbi:ribonuclease Y [Bacteroidetes/Chlorobi group bacterium MS-B_bin-24]|jgi:ribonuclease Y|nr:MAG: ribonuclease Y [Bacteroidetes/Chlorobi group bacterium MS-B_bin-24]